jgi:hypothetical protein
MERFKKIIMTSGPALVIPPFPGGGKYEEISNMRTLLCILLVISAVFSGISAAEVQKDFRYTNVNFTPIDTNGTEDISDDILLPAVLGDLLPDADGNGFFDVSYVLKKNGDVASTNPGQLYGVITVNNTTADNFIITDTFGTQFDVHPAKLCGGVDVIRVNATGYATDLSGTDQVVSATIDNDANTVDLEIALDEPLATDEELMIYIKFQTALKHLSPDTNTFVNEVTVNGEAANATVEFV